MCLPVGGLGYSSDWVNLNGCAYGVVGLDTVLVGLNTVLSGCAVGLDTVLSGCTSTGVLTSWWAWIQF